MKERPILFRGRLVRRILAGAKAQTRRIVKPQPELGELGYWWPSHKCKSMVELREMGGLGPYGGKGDRLWVREAFQLFDSHPKGGDIEVIGKDRLARGHRAPHTGVADGRPIEWTSVYRADGEIDHPEHGPARWRPSIHMPRWASRITLEVTGVRVERLQDISEEDAIAEGVASALIPADEYGPVRVGYCAEDDGKCTLKPTARAVFEELWKSINGADAWDANPFVWVVSFKRLEQIARAACARAGQRPMGAII